MAARKVRASLWLLGQADALAGPSTPAIDPFGPAHQALTRDLMAYGWKIGAISIAFAVLNGIVWEMKRRSRKRYYNEDYLKSDAWKRKRYIVLRRDGWKCVFCGTGATDVHHKRYARQIGREPIDWLISVCPRCHALQHPDKQAA